METLHFFKGVLNRFLEIGAFSCVMTFEAAFKADNIDAVGVAWVVRKGGLWDLRGSVGKLGGLLDSVGLLPRKGSSRA